MTGQCQDKTALFRAHCQQVPKTHYSSAEHRRPDCKQDATFFITLLCSLRHKFSQREFAAALLHLKPGKAPGFDSICPKLIHHAGAGLKSWLHDFLSSCLRRLKIPKIWRRALVVAIPKPGKPMGDPKSYRTISLLCFPYKILERLIYAHIEPLIDPLPSKEQAGFRRGKSTVDQVVLLT